MDILTTLNNSLLLHWQLFGWHAVVEVAFFSTLFYQTCRWLRCDRWNNLLPIFLGTCLCALLAHCMQLHTIVTAVLLFAPTVGSLFVIMHQETLQKNLITLKNITPPRPVHTDWLEELVRTALHIMTTNTSMVCAIEKTDSLQHYLEPGLSLDAPITHDLLAMVLHSSIFRPARLLWVSHTGQLTAVNAEWRLEDHEDWLTESLLMTKKSDCLVFKTNAQQRTFSLVAQAQLIEDIPACDALETIRKYLQPKGIDKRTDAKGIEYEAPRGQKPSEQHPA